MPFNPRAGINGKVAAAAGATMDSPSLTVVHASGDHLPVLAANSALCVVDPLTDERWDQLVDRHPAASAFHRSDFLRALSSTYAYKPFVLTHTPPGQPLTDGVVLCKVKSWLTGTRFVSIPFADHCDSLLAERTFELGNWFLSQSQQRASYVELRPLLTASKAGHGFSPGRSYNFHELDLTLPLPEIFQRMHKDSIQRKIRRAEKEQVVYERGRSPELLSRFYGLMVQTRRRHRMFPQPFEWFSNLLNHMGENAEIRIVSKNDTPLAALFTLRHRSSVVYKYGCSDERFHNVGGIPFLFWRLIEESKSSGIDSIDLGRSDLDNAGLTLFKDRLGADKKLLTYYRCGEPNSKRGTAVDKAAGIVRTLLCRLPDAAFTRAGKVLYRHIG